MDRVLILYACIYRNLQRCSGVDGVVEHYTLTPLSRVSFTEGHREPSSFTSGNGTPAEYSRETQGYHSMMI